MYLCAVFAALFVAVEAFSTKDVIHPRENAATSANYSRNMLSKSQAVTADPTSKLTGADGSISIGAENTAIEAHSSRQHVRTKGEFQIDWQNDVFLKDGQPYQVLSGSMHYFRIPRAYWRDRLRKVKAMGLNTIQTYIPWSLHEPWPGVYNLTEGNADFAEYVNLAQQEGLNVILRIGPYICETSMGGLPPWLLMVDKNMKLRTNDPSYMHWVTRWFNVLLPKLKSLLYSNGGPVIWLQVENEYGSYYTCDLAYLDNLRTLVRQHLGPEVILTTVDGPYASYLHCVANATGLLRTIDFGPRDGGDEDPLKMFKDLRAIQPDGPLVNSEFYAGWQSYWGEPFPVVSVNDFVKAYARLVTANNSSVSVNMYMVHGGTNLAFSSSAYGTPDWSPVTTSYDYDAPIREEGDTTAKFLAIRHLLIDQNSVASVLPAPAAAVPPNATKFALGRLPVQFVGSIFEPDIRKALNGNFNITAKFPLTFEDIWLDYGYLLYEHVAQETYERVSLTIGPNIRDRAYVFIDGRFKGILDRLRTRDTTVILDSLEQHSKLSILVENQARYGNTELLNELKGIVDNVTLEFHAGEKVALTGWTMYPVPLNHTTGLSGLEAFTPGLEKRVQLPGFFRARFSLPENITTNFSDTFFKFDNWGKGVLLVNGVNLGRYWPSMGPQRTLYVPGPFLKPYPEENEVLIFEVERASIGCHLFCYLESVDHHEIIGR